MKISKVFSIVICICLILFAFSNIVNADSQLEIGDYIQMGTYEDSPILWRYVADDDNGKLIVSDKILCEKYFGISEKYWNKAAIRLWLNSQSTEGERDPESGRYYRYKGEGGFLSDNNFTQSERNLMKSTTQWTMISINNPELSENGITDVFYSPESKPSNDIHDPFGLYYKPAEYYGIGAIPNIYHGAAMQTTDKVFLLDEMQLYNMYQNLGDVSATLVNDSQHKYYFLRSSFENAVTGVIEIHLQVLGTMEEYGIRPAFYLNETAVSGMTGSGTAEDPYILIPDPDYVSVEVNGEAVAFDVAPVMESDRVLVPMRAIFEDLGATVEWEGETETVTATKDDTVITLQIDNNVMTKNGEEIILDVPARLVGDRTLVPIRAVAEGLDATVDWIDEENKVVITK